MKRFIVVIYSAHCGTACKNGKNACCRHECVKNKKSGKSLPRLGYKVQSLGASEICIVVVNIREECAAAYEKRRKHERTGQNGEDRKRDEHKRKEEKKGEHKGRE
jgi:hypothetical protein